MRLTPTNEVPQLGDHSGKGLGKFLLLSLEEKNTCGSFFQRETLNFCSLITQVDRQSETCNVVPFEKNSLQLLEGKLKLLKEVTLK